LSELEATREIAKMMGMNNDKKVRNQGRMMLAKIRKQ